MLMTDDNGREVRENNTKEKYHRTLSDYPDRVLCCLYAIFSILENCECPGSMQYLSGFLREIEGFEELGEERLNPQFHKRMIEEYLEDRGTIPVAPIDNISNLAGKLLKIWELEEP